VVHGVFGQHKASLAAQRPARVGVDVKAREIAARYVQPDAVPHAKDVRSRIEYELKFIAPARFQQFGVFPVVAITRADDAVLSVEEKRRAGSRPAPAV